MIQLTVKVNILSLKIELSHSAISEKASFIYYFNQFGELKLYNRNTHESLTTSIKVDPTTKTGCIL